MITTESIIKVVIRQVAPIEDNLSFHKYYLETFIIKNKEIGRELLDFYQVKDMDSLFFKLKLGTEYLEQFRQKKRFINNKKYLLN